MLVRLVILIEDVGYYAKSEALKSILQFINSLPEEPKCIYNKTLDERKKFCKYCSAFCTVRIKEEPANEEDLEEEIDKIDFKEHPLRKMSQKQAEN